MGLATISKVPQISQSTTEESDFPALPRLSSRGSTHTTVARGTALWESLVGKPRVKASSESHRSFDPREEKRDTAATAREESARACPHSRRGLTPLGRLQNYPKIHGSTGEDERGSRPHPEEPCFRLVAGDEGTLFCLVGKGFLAFPSHRSRRSSQQESREELNGSCHHLKSPANISVHYRGI